MRIIAFYCSLLFFLTGFLGLSNNDGKGFIDDKEETSQESQEFDSSSFAMNHVSDSYEWHLADYDGHAISIPLPVLLWDDGGLLFFMSSEFHHGEVIVTKNGKNYKMHHNKIYTVDEEGNNIKHIVLDFSITKNVASMLISALLILFLFVLTAKSYKKNQVPGGIVKFLEPLVIFVRDDIAVPNIGERKAKLFLPYLLTVFFFIWINNIFGLLPIPPGGGANVTGNIAVTMVLAIFTLLITNFSGNRNYWSHIFDPLGSSFPTKGKILLYIILLPVELVSIITKPFALMVRLFANITAGHIIIISLTSLVFVFKTSLVAVFSVPFVLFISCIELLIAFLQAYIFTLLSALFIGLAVKEHH